MTFLNLAMIGGILAFNIPIIIHLFNRNRPNVVKWGAMHLLEQVVRVNRKRLKLEQIILLLVRASIPVLLALCMASPVLTGCQDLAGGSRSSVVVLFDNSYSMSAGGANSNHAAATQAATEILRDLRDGSDASVVMMAGGAPGIAPITDEPTMRMSLLTDELKKRTASYGMADVPASLEAAARIISTMRQPKRDMVVITDFQRVSWSTDQSAARARLAEWRGDAAIKPSLTFLHVGKEATDNIAIMEVSFSRTVVGVGQKVSIRANLKNFGGKPYPSLRVYLDVDGQRRGVTELTLGAGEDGQVMFSHAFDQPGSHVVRLFADGDATLKEDNEYLTAVQVLDRVPVLLIDGDPAPADEPLKGETGFLATALQPFKEGNVQLADLLEAKVIRVEAFKPETIDREKAVVLANVERLTDEQVRTLDGFVRGGGGLVIFPGNRVSAEWYNETLFDSGAGLLPARITALKGSITDASQHTAIATQTYAHPALAMFNDRRSGNLSTGEVWSWFQLETSADAAGVTTIARLESGDALLIEKRHGEGSVMLCSTACDADWGNLPARPFYLPLMQQVVSHAASGVEPPRNVAIGQPLLASLARSAIGRRATLTDPAGRRHPITIADRGSRGGFEFRATQQLGLYTLDFAGAGSVATADHPSLHFVVSSPRQESDLRQLSQSEIAQLAGDMNADVVTSIEAFHELDKTRRHGSEIWHWFFWAVLALCFLELSLQHWFATKRT